MTRATSPKIRAERVAIAAAAGLAVGKLGVGLATNSIGLLSAAADSVFDVAVSAFNLWSIRIADSPADEGHPFGHGKAENLAGLLQVAVIALVGGWLLVEGARRDYGVVLSGSLDALDLAIDRMATDALRAELRGQRDGDVGC